MKQGTIITGTALFALMLAAAARAEDQGGNSIGEIAQGAADGSSLTQLHKDASATAPSIMEFQANPEELYRDTEASLDLFGGGTLNEHDLDRVSGARIHHDGRLGLGAGGTFFFMRNLGIMGEAYSENPHPILVGEASGSLVLRFPLGESGLSPYIFGGGGHQFEPQTATFGHGGAGLEFRFSPNVGVFIDGRWVSTDRIGNYGMARAGFRFAM